MVSSKSRRRVELQSIKYRNKPEDDFAAQLRGVGPIGLLAIVVIFVGNSIFVPLSALLVLLWAWRSHTPWREIGYVRPKSWLLTIAGGIALGAVLKLVMKAVVMPLLGAEPVNQAFHYLAGNRAALPAAIYAMTVGAGFGEETLFRGFLFERFQKIIGTTTGAMVIIVVITSVWFGLDHYQVQGLAGVQQATIVGLVFGTIYAATGRLWMLIFAHAAFDLTALAIIYWDLETAVANFFFS